MNVTDPIADLLTRIRNAQKAQKEVVSVPASKMKIAIVHLLKQEGLVRAYKCVRDEKQGMIKIALKYQEGTIPKGVISDLKRISTPGRRVYVEAEKIPYVKNGYGIAILSTSRGIMTCREARHHHIGGELLCSAY
jgi:small subunit ribosomal protein S8